MWRIGEQDSELSSLSGISARLSYPGDVKGVSHLGPCDGGESGALRAVAASPLLGPPTLRA